MDPRRLLPELLDAALRAVDGRECVSRALRSFPATRVELFAIGKAASAMARGAHDALSGRIVRTLAITKDGHVDPMLAALPDVTVIEAAHPVPDERSLAAGEELLSRLSALDADTHPVFLVSGGSSSLIERLQPGVDLAGLRELNARGLAAGWDIGRLNAERSRLSRLKGGGVARLLPDRAALALFISDVPGDDPDVIGSGLLGRDQDRADGIERRIVANIDESMKAVIDAADARGLRLLPGPRRFGEDVKAVAAEFLDALRKTQADGLVWGGESTVELAANPGRGGRNQHLALLIARKIQPKENFTILAAGTDGTDGLTDDAGAMVDAGTVDRAELGGVDVERALAGFDSGLALEASEDLLHTGPTGTNVGDILIGLRGKARTCSNPV